MEPCANEVSGLLTGGILFLFQGSNTQALSCFREPTPCSQEVLGHTPTNAASLPGPVKLRCHPFFSPPDDHPDPPGKVCSRVWSRDASACWERCCAVTAPEHGVQQNEGPFVSRPWPGLTKGLGDAPAAPTGTGELMVGTTPHWLWKQQSTQGFWSRGTIRNCCGCSTGCFLKGNLQG